MANPLATAAGQTLVRELRTHAVTIYYWCLWNVMGSDPDHIFKITPFMREIWCSQRPNPQGQRRPLVRHSRVWPIFRGCQP